MRKGQRVCGYFVNAGPGVASFHVIGTLLDEMYLSGNPKNTLWGVQTVEVGAGNGAAVDVTVPAAGMFLLVDHDRLALRRNDAPARYRSSRALPHGIRRPRAPAWQGHRPCPLE
jgi:nitrite reductase (NO-forming)